MAITVVKSDKEEAPYLMFETLEIQEKDMDEEFVILVATITPVDETLKPLGQNIKYEVGSTEEEFHRKLRLDSDAAGKLEKKYCTDPEWNPGYKTKES